MYRLCMAKYGFQIKLLLSSLTPTVFPSSHLFLPFLLLCPGYPVAKTTYFSLTFWFRISDFLSLNSHPPILLLFWSFSHLLSPYFCHSNIFLDELFVTMFYMKWNDSEWSSWSWSLSVDRRGSSREMSSVV